MWKKFLAVSCIFVGILSFGYAYGDNFLNAANLSYYAGGNISGRIVTQPTNINKASNVAYGFQQYDVLEFNTMNTHMNKPLAFKFIEKETYTDYATASCTPTDTKRCNNTAITAWYSLSNDPIDYLSMGMSKADFVGYISGLPNRQYGLYNRTAAYSSMKAMNDKIDTNTKDQAYLTSRNLTHFHDVFDRWRLAGGMEELPGKPSRATVYGVPLYNQVLSNETKEEWLGTGHVYMPSACFAAASGNILYVDKGYAFGSIYWSSYNYSDDSSVLSQSYYNWAYDVTGEYYWLAHNTWEYGGALTSSGIKHDLRAAAYIDQTKLDQVVFAVSAGLANGKGKIINDTSAVLQPRVYNSAYSVSLSKLARDTSGTTLVNNKIVKDGTMYLNGTASTGNSVISALIFDRNGNFLYYEPLDSSANFNGNGYVAFDTSGLTTGTYQIAIVNEEYDESIPGEMQSSKLSNVQTFEIVDPVSITASAKTGLEVYKNVKQSDTIATYTTSNGVNPITVTVVSDTTVNGHENDYQRFSVSNGNVIVNDPDGLNAGDYYFKLNAADANGDPIGGVNSTIVHIVVSKTNLAVAFNDPNQTKKSITEATAGWSETATATPSTGTKVTYATSGGTVGLIDYDKDSGAISYKGGTGFGKITLKATADDDPNTGNDNYNPASTTKEIVIYREVDGYITPHKDSSSKTSPSFQTSQANVKQGGEIGTITGTLGTTDDASTTGKTTYTYGLKNDGDDYNYFSVNASTGKIYTIADLSTTTGSYNIIVTVSDKWSTKEIPVTIDVGLASAENLQFYENSTSNTVINTKTVNFTDTNVNVYATVKGSSNTNPVTYKVKDGSTNVITINQNSGAVTITGTGTVTIVAEKQGASGQADAKAELTFTVTAGAQTFIYTTDSTLSKEMPKGSNGKYNAYEKVYEPNGTFNVYTTGNPAGSTVTYKLKDTSPTDVISVDSDGTIHILNASMSTQIGKVIVEATSHDPNGNYEDKTIELPITITKAKQSVSFAEDPIYVTSGKGSVTPVIDAQDISSNAGGANVEDTKTLISVSSSIDKKIAKTTDGATITYDYDKDGGIDIPIHVVKQGNRNYEKGEADGTLHILGPDENILEVSDVGEVEYGERFTIESLQDDSASTNVQYTFTVDDTTYITSPTVNGNVAEFDAIKITGKKKITVTITRTADSEKPLSVKKQITVVPKEIEITIEDKEKYKGETNPPLTFEDFSDQLVVWNGTKDIIQASDVKLSTTAQMTSPAGDYPIKGDSAYLNKTYPNYSFTFEEGTLAILEENIEDDWYHMETDDGQPYKSDWTNQDVHIISDHNEYVNLSKDQSSWNKCFVSVTQEGNNEQSFWMKKDSGAITSEKKETIKIDKTASKVKNIKAKDSNNKLQDIINKLSGGIFFKPGTTFEITTDDKNGQMDVSGTESIAYKIYKQDSDKTYGTPMKQDTLTVTDEKASITISETTGTYKVCVIPTDKAGNEGTESCHEVILKKIDVDEDGDGKPDFNDPDGDGCPDLNIVLGKDDDGKWIKLNVDVNGDGKPDLNIDSDGDGVADINIDQDDDGKPDLNIVKVTKWKPTVCVSDQAEEYCTDSSLIPNINVDLDHDGRPDINIDLNHNGIPDIDIDSDGDGISDINVDEDKDGKADTHIKKMDRWEIDDTVFEANGTKFQTMTGLKPDVNNELVDNGVKVEYPDGEFSNDTILKVTDITKDKKAEVTEKAKDLMKDQRVIQVFDVKLLKNGTEIQPEGILKVKLPVKSNIKNPGLLILNENGGYEKVNATFEDGYLIYETNQLGQFTIIGDVDEQEPIDTDVKGAYYPGANMGGALTGDTTNMMMYMGLGCISIGMMLLILYKRKQEE